MAGETSCDGARAEHDGDGARGMDDCRGRPPGGNRTVVSRGGCRRPIFSYYAVAARRQHRVQKENETDYYYCVCVCVQWALCVSAMCVLCTHTDEFIIFPLPINKRIRKRKQKTKI